MYVVYACVVSYLCMYTNIYRKRWFNLQMFVCLKRSKLTRRKSGRILKTVLKWEGLPKLEAINMKKKTNKFGYIYRFYIQ